jgi:hypothetical protein
MLADVIVDFDKTVVSEWELLFAWQAVKQMMMSAGKVLEYINH